MATFKKRSESSLVTALGNYLQTLENLGKIACWSRQQAGNITFRGAPRKRDGGQAFYKLRLGREGISDLWCIPNLKYIHATPMIWIEAKLDGEDQRPCQVEFQKIVERCGHVYWLIHDCDELEIKLKELAIL